MVLNVSLAHIDHAYQWIVMTFSVCVHAVFLPFPYHPHYLPRPDNLHSFPSQPSLYFYIFCVWPVSFLRVVCRSVSNDCAQEQVYLASGITRELVSPSHRPLGVVEPHELGYVGLLSLAPSTSYTQTAWYLRQQGADKGFSWLTFRVILCFPQVLPSCLVLCFCSLDCLYVMLCIQPRLASTL